MSTIVVVKKNGKAVIAADSRFTQGSTLCDAKYVTNCEKIHRFGDSYIGITGSSTHHDVFLSLAEKYPREIELRERRDIFRTYMRVHKRLKEEFFLLTTEEEKDQPYESSKFMALIANPWGIFELSYYREVTEYNRFWAIGSGADIALGALYATYERLATPAEIAREAIHAAAEFDQATALPMNLYTVKLGARPAKAKTARKR